MVHDDILYLATRGVAITTEVLNYIAYLRHKRIVVEVGKMTEPGLATLANDLALLSWLGFNLRVLAEEPVANSLSKLIELLEGKVIYHSGLPPELKQKQYNDVVDSMGGGATTIGRGTINVNGENYQDFMKAVFGQTENLKVR